VDNPEVVITSGIRLANALVWTVFVVQIMRRKARAINLTARRLVLSVIFLGMWLLFIGSLAQVRLIPGDVVRTLYTVFTGYAAVVGFAIITGNDDGS
jgi:hypothetical protein